MKILYSLKWAIEYHSDVCWFLNAQWKIWTLILLQLAPWDIASSVYCFDFWLVQWERWICIWPTRLRLYFNWIMNKNIRSEIFFYSSISIHVVTFYINNHRVFFIDCDLTIKPSKNSFWCWFLSLAHFDIWPLENIFWLFN